MTDGLPRTGDVGMGTDGRGGGARARSEAENMEEGQLAGAGGARGPDVRPPEL